MRILIIPSWYPTHSNPIVGSFFQEQAVLMQDEYDIKVLHGVKQLKGYRRYYLEKLFPFLKQKHFIDNNNFALTPPQAVSFKYPVISNFKEEKNLDLMLSFYDAEFSHLVHDGWKPDLIHAHSTLYAGIIGAFLSKKHSIPFIITEHQVFLLHEYSKFIQKKIFQSLESAFKILSVSYHQMRSILMHGIKCEPAVVGNYINENLFILKKREHSKLFRILNITYPSYIKDNETFFKAISEVIKKGHADIAVTIIGNNAFHDLKDANVNVFNELAKKYNVSEFCKLISFVERKNMPAQFHDHDVFVSTSIAETFGVAICEAMATGMPVVSTLSGGVDDTINNDNGIKVNIKDHKAVAQALINIKTQRTTFDPETVRNSVVKKFGTAAFKSRLKNFYNEANK